MQKNKMPRVTARHYLLDYLFYFLAGDAPSLEALAGCEG